LDVQYILLGLLQQFYALGRHILEPLRSDPPIDRGPGYLRRQRSRQASLATYVYTS
jgi:hypothetical protein